MNTEESNTTQDPQDPAVAAVGTSLDSFAFEWTRLTQKERKVSRKAKKRIARRESAYRRCMVRYAGDHRIHWETIDDKRNASAPATGWASRRKVRVPRSLRPILGLYVAGKRETQAWRAVVDIGKIIAAHGPGPYVAADDPAVVT